MTFSQLSSQAANNFLASYGDIIAADFVDAIELRHRLNEFATLADSLKKFYNETNYLMQAIINFANISAKLEVGFQNFYDVVVRADFSKLKITLGNFSIVYKSFFEENRQKAANFIALNKFQTDNLKILMASYRSSFDNFYDAYWFYSVLLQTLNDIVTSTELSRIYLKLSMEDETQKSQQYSPVSFYADPYNADFCNNQYIELIQSLESASPVFSYFKQRISSWLQANSNIIINTTLGKVFANQLERNETIDIIPSLMDLLTGEENINSTAEYYMWIEMIDNLNKISSAQISLCLLQYGESLERTYNLTPQSGVKSPVLSLNNDLMTLIDQLNGDNQLIDALSRSYITGSISGVSCVAKIMDLSKSLSQTLMQLLNQILTSSNDWQNDVIKWQESIIEQYLSLINSIVSLVQFLPDDANLKETVLNMNIWLYPKLRFDILNRFSPTDLILYYGITYDMRNHLSYYGFYWTNYFVNRATEFDRYYVEQTARELQVKYNEWLYQKDNFIDFINKYNAGFVIDGSFVS